MQLTEKQRKLIEKIPKYRRQRKAICYSCIFTIILVVFVGPMGYLEQNQTVYFLLPIMIIFLSLLLRKSPIEELEDLLTEYVSHDADSIKRLSGNRDGTTEPSA